MLLFQWLASWWLIVVDFNVLVAETDTKADVTVPVAEWMSDIRSTSEMWSSKKACLLFDFYLNNDVFHSVSFEMIYRTADAETVKKKPMFSLSNDGVTDRVKDVFEFSLDDGVTRYQVIDIFVVWILPRVARQQGADIADVF